MIKLDGKSVKELIELARKWGHSGYSKLKKAELIKLLAGGQKPDSGPRKAGKPMRTEKTSSGQEKRAKSMRPKTKAPSRKAAPTSGNPAVQKAGRKGAVSKKPGATSGATTLPRSYQDGKMVLVPRDPRWLYCYWDLDKKQMVSMKPGQKPTIRVMDVTQAEQAREVRRFEVPAEARSWYIEVDRSDRKYRAEIGLQDETGSFVPWLVSTDAPTPRNHESSRVDTQSFGKLIPGEAPAPAASPLARTAIEPELFRTFSSGGSPGGMDSAEAQKMKQWAADQGMTSEESMSSSNLQKGH